MRSTTALLLASLWLGCALPAAADAPVTAARPHTKTAVAVMELAGKGGVTAEQMEALGDLLANHIRGLGPFRVIGKSDIQAALKLEEQKSLLGCSDEGCMVELGGMLGVRYLVVGSVGLFGETYLLNLKLLDVEKVEVDRGVSRSIQGSVDLLLAECALAAEELFAGLEGVPPPAGTGRRARPSGWFVPPGSRRGWFRLTVGAGGSVSPPALVPEGEPNYDDLEATAGSGSLAFGAGYNLLDWLYLGLRIHGSLGGRSNDAAFRCVGGGLELQGSMLPDSLLQPFAYLGAGFDYTFQDGAYNLRGPGFVLSLGLGANLFVRPTFFIGAQLGGTTHAFLYLWSQAPEQSNWVNNPSAAWVISVDLMVHAGWEF